jgi:prepilin-type N-terminal cleavage/methylation domain-containing protein
MKFSTAIFSARGARRAARGEFPPRPQPQASSLLSAFTLIEIMVAVMVFSMVIAAVYSTWALVMRAAQVGQDAAAQAQRQRVVLRAIGDALMGVESFQASQQYYWFKLGNGDEPFLSFVAHLPDSYARNGKFVGAAGGRDASTRRVTFSLAAGADGEKDLILRQSPILIEDSDEQKDEEKYPLVLAKNVKTFSIEWWGTNELNHAEWNTEWDDNMTNTIPAMLRVRLVLGASAAGSSAPEFAATRIYTVPSQMMPASVQRGGAGGPGGGNRSLFAPK